MSVNIAVDGPSGAGKSTIAKLLAERMSYIYVDTGALYRSVALYMLREGVDINDPYAIASALGGVDVRLCYRDGVQQVELCGENVSQLIRTPEVSMAASKISAVAEVRAFLLELQRSIARENNVIMDGRDIGTVVLPDADVKIFLTASAEKRAERRYKELQEKGDLSTYQQVLDDINKRDYDDAHREIAPLKKTAEAVEVDTTLLTLEQSVDEMYKTVCSKLGIEKAGAKPSSRREMMDFSRVKPVTEPKTVKKGTLVVYAILRFFVTLFYKIKYRLVFEGTQNIPKTGSIIFASNHRSNSDPVLGSLKVPVPCSYMAKEELFHKGKAFVKLITFMGAFPVERGSGDTSAISLAVEKLEQGRNLMIYPEGTRSKDGTLGKGKTGVALIAALAQVPVVPMAISFKGEKLKFRQKLIISYGKPISPDELRIDSSDIKRLKIIKKRIMVSIAELVDSNVNKL